MSPVKLITDSTLPWLIRSLSFGFGLLSAWLYFEAGAQPEPGTQSRKADIPGKTRISSNVEAKKEKPEDESPPELRLMLRALKSRLRLEEKPLGDGVIRGRVTDDIGNPVPGIRIEARQEKRKGRRRPERTEERLLEFAEKLLRNETLTWKGESDGEGYYELKGLPESTYTLLAKGEGYKIKPEEKRGCKPGEVWDFKAGAGAGLLFRLLLPGGELAERGDLNLIGLEAGKRLHLSWSTDSPFLFVPRGKYLVSALSEKNGLVYDCEKVPLSVSQKDNLKEVTLHLTLTTQLICKVIFPEGEVWSSAHVILSKLKPGIEPEQSLRSPLLDDWASPDPYTREANYCFSDLEPGRYAVGLNFRWGCPPFVWKECRVEKGENRVDLEVPPLDPSQYVALRVLDPEDVPVSDFSWHLSWRQGQRGGGSIGSGYVEFPDGSLWLLLPCHVNAPDTYLKVTVTAENFGTKTVEFPLRKVNQCVVKFSRPAFLFLELLGYRENDLFNRLGFYLKGESEDSHSEVGVPDEEGFLVLGPVEPGSYTLVCLMRHRWPRRTAYSLTSGREVERELRRLFRDCRNNPRPLSCEAYEVESVDLQAGENRLAVEAPETFLIKVGVPEAPPGVRVYFVRKTRGLIDVRDLDPGGMAFFDHAISGEYLIRASGPNVEGQEEVTVQADTEIVLELKPKKKEEP